MDDGSDLFRRVRRGYDPAEVHHRLLELTAAATRAEGRVLELSRRLRDLEEASAEALQRAEADDSPPASFDVLGDRIGKILGLAEEEAAAIRAAAIADAESLQNSAEEAAERCTNAADTYAEERRGAAEAEAAGIIQAAAERCQAVEAAYEAQRAETAQAASDLETTLARRRETWEQQLAEQLKSSQEKLAANEARLSQVSSEADRIRSDAEEQARRLVEGGKRRAQQAVARVMADAHRVRVESERELAATIERKKSIDAQLTKDLNLMLSTLSASDATTIETERYDLEDDQASGDGSDGDETVRTRPFVNETVSGADTATAQPAGNGLAR